MSYSVPIATREDAIVAYNKNKLYDLRGGSLTMCEAFIDACRYLLREPLVESEQTGVSRMELDPKILHESLKKAEDWYHANYRSANATGGIRFSDFTDFRA